MPKSRQQKQEEALVRQEAYRNLSVNEKIDRARFAGKREQRKWLVLPIGINKPQESK